MPAGGVPPAPVLNPGASEVWRSVFAFGGAAAGEVITTRGADLLGRTWGVHFSELGEVLVAKSRGDESARAFISRVLPSSEDARVLPVIPKGNDRAKMLHVASGTTSRYERVRRQKETCIHV